MNTPTRILILSPPLDLRGTTVRTRNAVRALAPLGYEFHIAARPGPLAEAVAREGATVHPFPLDRGSSGLLLLPRLLRLVRRVEPDLIHLRHHQLVRAVRPLLWFNPLPVVVSVSTPPAPGPLRLPLRHTRAVIAVSDQLAEELVAAHRVPRGLLAIIRDATQALPEPSPPPAGMAQAVAFLGRLEEDRGVRLIPGVAGRVLARLPSARFLIVGEGHDDLRLRRSLRRLGLNGQVHVVPPLLDYRRVLQDCHLLLSPALKEGLGIFALEAMAVGRPVVAVAVGGVFAHVRDGRTGLLARPGDQEELADRIVQLLTDPEGAAALGRNAWELVRQHFTLEEFARAKDTVYRRAGAVLPGTTREG